ncbi:MAG: SPASM domain-containing protein [Bacillota bacterium]
MHSIGQSFKFLHSLGARSVVIRPVMGNVSAMALELDDWDIYAREVFCQAQRTAMHGQSPGQDDDLETAGICGIGLWHIAVDVDGTLYPCYRLSGIETYRMGHIDQGLVAAPPAELINLYDWEDPGRCGACTRRILCSRGCYSERLLVPHTSACDNWERVVGERIISLNFQNDDVMAMRPVL